MAILIKEFGTVKEMEDFLNDVLISKPLDATKKYNVRNLTLTFTTPAATITFPNTPEFETATLYKIMEQIETQSAGRAQLRMYGQGQAGRTAHIAFAKDGDVFTGGSAASVLGLAAGTVGANAIVAASIVQIFTNPQSYTYAVAYSA